MKWTHRLVDTISYKVRSGFSDGDYTWGSLATAAARVEEYPKIVRSVSGEELAASHRIATETDIPTHARVWLPGADTNDATESYSILRRDKAKTLDGAYTLYLLTLGRS